MKKTLFLVPLLFLNLTSCNSSDNIIEKEKITKHVVELNLNNYFYYFDITYESRYISSGGLVPGISYEEITFKGCLSYAFYEYVTISYQVEEDDYFLILNAAGNGSTDKGQRVTITNVTGSVTYWM